MRSSTTSGRKIPTATHPNSSHVPISVYRKLAAELQTAEAMLESLNAQNQNLAKQNQQLRQEIEKAVSSILHLQQVADAATVHQNSYYRIYDYRTESSRPGSMPSSKHHSRSSTGNSVAGPSPFPVKTESVMPEKVYAEVEEGRYRRRSQPESSSEVNGWGLAIAILLIVLTAFGAGYLIVRPLLPSR